jgi:hypothetical protein
MACWRPMRPCAQRSRRWPESRQRHLSSPPLSSPWVTRGTGARPLPVGQADGPRRRSVSLGLSAQCGAAMRIVAFVTKTATLTCSLGHIGEPTQAPVPSPARAPPTWEETFDQTPVFDPTAAAPGPSRSTRPSPGSTPPGLSANALASSSQKTVPRVRALGQRACCLASQARAGSSCIRRVPVGPAHRVRA